MPSSQDSKIVPDEGKGLLSQTTAPAINLPIFVMQAWAAYKLWGQRHIILTQQIRNSIEQWYGYAGNERMQKDDRRDKLKMDMYEGYRYQWIRNTQCAYSACLLASIRGPPVRVARRRIEMVPGRYSVIFCDIHIWYYCDTICIPAWYCVERY